MGLINTKHKKEEELLVVAFVIVKIFANIYKNGFGWKTEIKMDGIERNHREYR